MTSQTNRNLPSAGRNRAFSLLELLVVIAIMIMIMALAIPSITSLKGAGDVNKAAYDVSGTIERARAYAIANNTYVWVGFVEVDQSQTDSAIPQNPGIGRLAISVVASKDGTKIYDENAADIGTDWTSKTKNGTGLMQLGKLVRFDNIHLAESLGVPPATGNMARAKVDYDYLLGNNACSSVLTFTFPLGKPAASAKYTFEKVIQIDPQGSAKVVMETNYETIVEWMEVGLQQSHGNAMPAAPSDPNVGNHVALQIDGLTGAVKLYRP